MNELSIANIEFIKHEISKSGITFSHLIDDLIDHVCCDTEYEMSNGLPFEKAYNRVKEKIGIEGLERVQHETLYLINKKYRIMKKTMKIMGVVAPIILAFGALFKIMHWPGAGIMLVLGFFMLSFIFLPSAFYVTYIEVSNRSKKATYFAGFIGTFLLSISFLFKIMHWPGTGFLMLLGVVAMCLVFLPMLMVNKLRDKEKPMPAYLFVLAFAGLIIFIISFLFKAMRWPGAGLLMLSGVIMLFVIAFPIYAYRTYKDEQHVKNSFIYLVIVLIWFIVPISMISLNISTNVLQSEYEMYNNTDKDLAFLKERNNMLLSKLGNNAAAISIDKSAEALSEALKDAKIEMVKFTNHNPNAKLYNSENKSINIWQIEAGSADGIFNAVMYGNKKLAVEINEALQNFQNKALAVNNNPEYMQVIKGYLQFDLSRPTNENDVLLNSLNNLSFMEVQVEMAKQMALLQLIQNK
ncbi:MAG TPA: hypothetical protein VIO15_13555 [Bacteroidales bacterium]